MATQRARGSAPHDDPASWLLAEPGWTVVSSDGRPFGAVGSVAGEQQIDIFDGIAVDCWEDRTVRYVPADLVVALRPGTVTVAVAANDVRGLAPIVRTPGVMRRPDEPLPSRLMRLATLLRPRSRPAS